MRLIILSVLLAFSTGAFARDADEIRDCLEHWKEHPFKEKTPKFRTLSTRVRVMGIGNEIGDTVKTDKPELVLVKPNVSVMSKTTLRLMNPNGWYCLKGKVAVLGKSEIMLHCNAKLASANSGAVVLGSDDAETGVTVLGESRVQRVGCQQ